MPLSMKNLCLSMGDEDCITNIKEAVMLKPYPSFAAEYYNKIRADGDKFEFDLEKYVAATSIR